MPLSGVGAPQSIYPGDLGTFMGKRAIPGGPVDREVDMPELLPAGLQSRTVVIAAQFGFHPSSQRQLVWRGFFTSGTSTIDLLASIDNINWVLIDSVDGGANFQRAIPSDPSSAQTEDAGSPPSTIESWLSSYRFLAVRNVGASDVDAIFDCTCQ